MKIWYQLMPLLALQCLCIVFVSSIANVHNNRTYLDIHSLIGFILIRITVDIIYIPRTIAIKQCYAYRLEDPCVPSKCFMEFGIICIILQEKEFRSWVRGASLVLHPSLQLMNRFNKTDAAFFSCRLCFLRTFPFIRLNIE